MISFTLCPFTLLYSTFSNSGLVCVMPEPSHLKLNQTAPSPKPPTAGNKGKAGDNGGAEKKGGKEENRKPNHTAPRPKAPKAGNHGKQETTGVTLEEASTPTQPATEELFCACLTPHNNQHHYDHTATRKMKKQHLYHRSREKPVIQQHTTNYLQLTNRGASCCLLAFVIACTVLLLCFFSTLALQASFALCYWRVVILVIFNWLVGVGVGVTCMTRLRTSEIVCFT